MATKLNPKDLAWRLATIEDYQRVMDISEGIYSGMDYLPGMYMTLLHEHKSNMYVIEYQGKIVSFVSMKGEVT